MGIGAQYAVKKELERLFHTHNFPAPIPLPFTPSSTSVWKLNNYPYQACRQPTGAKVLLALLNIPGAHGHPRSVAVLVSASMVVTRVQLPNLPQSLFRGTVFDGYLDRSQPELKYTLMDCLAFKGRHDPSLDFFARRALLCAFLNSMATHQADKNDAAPSSGLLAVSQSDIMPIVGMPSEGTWFLVPQDKGVIVGKVSPDLYVVCFDDVRSMLPRDEASVEPAT